MAFGFRCRDGEEGEGTEGDDGFQDDLDDDDDLDEFDDIDEDDFDDNFDDDFEKIGSCDWIIEVVIERLDIKKQIFVLLFYSYQRLSQGLRNKKSSRQLILVCLHNVLDNLTKTISIHRFLYAWPCI